MLFRYFVRVVVDMAKKFEPFTLGTVIVFLSSFLLFGTSVRQLNLSEMVGYADRVFYGKCVAAESKLDPDSGVTVREYRFHVIENLKGVRTGEEVLVRQLMTMGSQGPSIPGIPSYRKGQELLLFLHADSRLGLTSPVGMQQGTFRPLKMESGEIGFVNPLKNRNLTYALESGSPAVQALSSDELYTLESGQPVPLSKFREMVRKLDQLHEREGGVVK